MSINRVNISGNLTRDAELRATQAGTQILTFGVAVNDRRRNPQTGDWEDYPNYIDCVVFGNRAEPLSRFLSKGTKVAVEGKLRYHGWEAEDGSKRSRLEVVVDEVELMSQRADAPQAQRQRSRYPQQAASPAQVPAPRAPQPQQGAYPAQVAQTPYQRQAAPYPAPQAPVSAPQAYQQQMPMPQAPIADYYDEDIPF